MPSKFTCKNHACRDFRERIRLDHGFHCTIKGCRGMLLLEGIAPTPWWQGRRVLVGGLGLLMLLLLGGKLLIPLLHSNSAQPPKPLVALHNDPVNENQQQQEALAKRQAELDRRAAQLDDRASDLDRQRKQDRQEKQERQEGQEDLGFKLNELVACAQMILDTCHRLNVSEAIADTKMINGNNMTAIGRSKEETLERAQNTFTQGSLFAEKAAENLKKVYSESHRYMEILSQLDAFDQGTVATHLARAVEREENPPRTNLAVGLAKRHWEAHVREELKLETVVEDFRSNASY